MDAYTSDLLRKFDRAIKFERVDDLQRNPYHAAMAETGLPIENPITQAIVQKHLDKYVKSNKSGAYIFGDTYTGMPISLALAAIRKQDFVKDQSKNQSGVANFRHTHHRMTASIHIDQEYKLASIMLSFSIDVDPRQITQDSFCGLGAIDCKVIGRQLRGKINATNGFEIKMAILRRMVVVHNEDSVI